MQEIFWGYDYIPVNIKNEFVKRWKNIEKISLEEFMQAIKEGDKNSRSSYWGDATSILHAYEEYKLGCIGTKYPLLPKHPAKLLQEIVFEANEMIHF